jgi:murein DD-endopeptidase MepM/ murein hydrolase activator NlpD
LGVLALCLCAALYVSRDRVVTGKENPENIEITAVHDEPAREESLKAESAQGEQEIARAQIPGLRAPETPEAPALPEPQIARSPTAPHAAPLSVTTNPTNAPTDTTPNLTAPAKPETAAVELEAPDETVPSQTGRSGLVERGDTAASLLSPYLKPAEIDELTKACAKVFLLTKIRDDRRYEVSFPKGVFTFEYEINPEELLIVRKTSKGFVAVKQAQKYDVVVDRVQGDVHSSLFLAVHKAGERPELAMALADIFAWEVDFLRDIRAGDSFKAVLEKRYRDGRFVGYGRIFAAEFVNQGEAYQGFLFHDQDGNAGYYDEQGKNLRKAFLRAPLKFSRISSGFSKARLHPVLNIVRPHFGVDYAAPMGTAVKTVGDGTVVAAGWRSGGGKTVHIKHANGYETMYMHLSRFGTGVKPGKHVKQGEVIGYVGMTGLATGPHLDFRLEKDNQFINPSQLDNPRAQSLPVALMPAFRDKIAAERDRLERSSFAQEKPSSAAPKIGKDAAM